MGKRFGVLLSLLMLQGIFAQDPNLPSDLRQQNLLLVAPQLFNPVMSLEQEYTHRFSAWSRWQWQTIDLDPTSVMVSYTGARKRMAYGAGFLEHNTGVFLQTGGFLHTAYRFTLSPKVRIDVGVNLFGYLQEVADNRFFLQQGIAPFTGGSDFVMRLAPALQVGIGKFALGMSSENLVDYNITRSTAVTDSGEKIFTGMLHFTAVPGPGSGFIRPQVYIRRLPGYDTQYGFNVLWSASRFWAQGGYNSFYGASLGLGGRFLDRLSLGGVVEYDSPQPDNDALTYGIMAALDLGPKLTQEKPRARQAPVLPERDLLQEAEEARARQDAIAAEQAARQAAQQRRDSLQQAARQAVAERLADSLARVEAARAVTVQPQQGERYQEVAAEAGLQPGYYLIANVFGTQKYFEAFMRQLQAQGLEPQSFFREANQFNYVHLGRFPTMEAARAARDSGLRGRYKGELWILRIR